MAVPFDIKQAIRRFAPIVWFHSKESYFPSSVAWYLRRARLRLHRSGKSDLSVRRKGQITLQNLAGQRKDGKYSGSRAKNNFFLQIPNDSREKTTRRGSLSSAVCYAPKLNRQQLCIRYGWKFSSDMPDIYIKRAGIEEEEVKAKILNTNLEKLEEENQELQTKFALMKDSSEKEIQKLNEKLVDIESGKGFLTLLATLTEKQKQMSKTLKGLTGMEFDVVLPAGANKKT